MTYILSQTLLPTEQENWQKLKKTYICVAKADKTTTATISR